MKHSKPYEFKPIETPIASEPAMSAYGCTADTTAEPLHLHHPTSYEMKIIRRSEEDIKAGRLYTQEEANKMMEQWLS